MFTKTIEEVTETLIDYRGKTPPKTSCGVKLITAKIIKDGFVQNNNLEYISEEIYETWMRRGMPKQWDILITTEAPLGEVAQLRTTEKIALAQRVILLRGNPQIIDQQYYFQALKSSFVQAGLQMRATGTTVAGIKQSELRQVEIPYYPLPTQRKIAAILSAYDALIENNTRRIKILEEMAGAIYREWFAEFRFPGHEGVKMVEPKLGLIPQGWEIKRLSDLVETQYGYTESATDEEVGPKFVRGKDINKNSYIDWDTVPFCPIESEKHVKYQLYANDILVIRMADPGKVAIIEKEIDAVFASYLIRLKLRSNRLSPYYLFYTLLDERYQDYVYGVSTGTTRKSASAGVITDFDLVVPTDEVRNRFEIVIDSLRKMLNNLLEKNASLRQTRNLLLPKLISGEIDVSELKIDTGGIEREQGGPKSHIY